MYTSTTVFSICMESDKRLENSIKKPHTMPLLLMWNLIASSNKTAWWNGVSAKQLHTNLHRWRVVHTSNEWVDSSVTPSTENTRTPKWLCLAAAWEGMPVHQGSPSLVCIQESFPHNLRLRHMALTISLIRRAISMRQSICGEVEWQIHWLCAASRMWVRHRSSLIL